MTQTFDADDLMPSIPVTTTSDDPTAPAYLADAQPAPSPPSAAPRRSSRPIQPVTRLEYHSLGGNFVTADVFDVLQVIGSCFNVCSLY